jgi:hypothetical protein
LFFLHAWGNSLLLKEKYSNLFDSFKNIDISSVQTRQEFDIEACFMIAPNTLQ